MTWALLIVNWKGEEDQRKNLSKIFFRFRSVKSDPEHTVELYYVLTRVRTRPVLPKYGLGNIQVSVLPPPPHGKVEH